MSFVSLPSGFRRCHFSILAAVFHRYFSILVAVFHRYFSILVAGFCGSVTAEPFSSSIS